MKLDLQKSLKISPKAQVKVINDFFSDTKNCIEEDEILDSEQISIHAGALCLYAAALITKIYETNADEIRVESNEREIALQDHIRNLPKYSHLTDEEVKNKAHAMILKDIRNCFAHGNFKISYNQNDLYFILMPQRKDFDINLPLIISKDSLKQTIMNTISKLSFSLLLCNNAELRSKVSNDLNNLLKTLMLPTQMLKIADHYLELGKTNKQLVIDKKRCNLIKHILLVAQITYEQDDYYNIFGKNSSIFEKISLIRNSIAHDSFIFTELTSGVNYTDRSRILTEPLNKNLTYLTVANELKEIIKLTLDKNHKEESIQDLKEKLIECFDLFLDNINQSNISQKG